MSKDKKRIVEDNSKETIFYYDIIGSGFIIISLITFGKLGEIGKLFSNLSKIVFGDFYWLIIFYILIYGCYLLFFHEKISLKNNKIIGVILITIIVLIFSHFPIHNYFLSFIEENSYLKLLINYYKDYLNGQSIEVLGGGLMGGLLFFIIYYLIGSSGVIIFSIIILLLSISLIINKPILNIVTTGASKFKYIKKYLNKFNQFFKYEFGLKKEEKEKTLNEKKVPIKLLNTLDNNIVFKMQESTSLEICNIIKCILNNFNLSYEQNEIIVSYQVTTYTYIIYDKLDEEFINNLINKIIDLVDFDLLYSYSKQAKYDVLVLQITNEYDIALSLYDLILKSTNFYHQAIPIGISYNNTTYEYLENNSSNLILLGDHNTGIKTFCISQVIKYLIKGGLKNYIFYFFDSLKKFNLFDDIGNYYYNINDLFDNLYKVIDERITIFNEKNVLNYEEYLNKITINNEILEMKRIIVFIDELVNGDINYIYFENKLIYINQFSKKVGIEVIYIVRDNQFLTSTILSSFDLKILFKSSKEMSLRILNNDNGYYLKDKGDVIVSEKNSSTRVKLPLITIDEINKIIKYIIKK